MGGVVFDMIRARRMGRLIPRWQLSAIPPARGTLLVRDQYDRELNRTCRRAQLIRLGVSPAKQPIPTLVDAVLLWVSHDTWVLGGIESEATDSGDERYYAQTWLLSPLKTSAVAKSD